MRTRLSILFSVLALVVVACGDPQADDQDPTQLSYSLEPGTTLVYEVDLDQTIKVSSTGNAEAMGGEDGFPGAVDLHVVGTTLLNHEISEGPEPDTFEIHITGEFTDLEVTGTIDGEPFDEGDELPDIAGMDAIDATVVVDAQGNLVVDDDQFGGDLFGDLGSADPFTQFGQAGGFGQFFGFPLPDGEVSVGDSWSNTIETPMMLGMDPATAEIVSEVTGTDEVDGEDVLVIETTTSTSPVEIDFGELLLGFLGGLGGEGLGGGSDELSAQLEELRFLINVDGGDSQTTTLFDADDGLIRDSDIDSTVSVVMDMNMPDEDTGEMVEFTADMQMQQSISYQLVDISGA